MNLEDAIFLMRQQEMPCWQLYAQFRYGKENELQGSYMPKNGADLDEGIKQLRELYERVIKSPQLTELKLKTKSAPNQGGESRVCSYPIETSAAQPAQPLGAVPAGGGVATDDLRSFLREQLAAEREHAKREQDLLLEKFKIELQQKDLERERERIKELEEKYTDNLGMAKTALGQIIGMALKSGNLSGLLGGAPPEPEEELTATPADPDDPRAAAANKLAQRLFDAGIPAEQIADIEQQLFTPPTNPTPEP